MSPGYLPALVVTITLGILGAAGMTLAVVVFVWKRHERLEEKKLELQERGRAGQVRDEPMPPDLVALAMQESEEWAQEEALKAIRERYQDLRDWKKVREQVVGTAFGQTWGKS